MPVTIHSDITASDDYSILARAERFAYIAGMQGAEMDGDFGLVQLFCTITQGPQNILAQSLNPAKNMGAHVPGQPIPTQALAPGQNIAAIAEDYSHGYAVDRILWEQMDPVMRVQFVQSLGVAGIARLTRSAFNILANATTRLGPDGVSLINDAHPSGGTAATYDNSYATALDFAAFATVREDMRKRVGPDGQQLGQMPGLVIGPVDLEDSFDTLFRAPNSSDSLAAPNFANAAGIRIPAYTTAYLTAATRWFVLSRGAPQAIRMHVQRAPGVETQTINLTVGDIALLDRTRLLTLVTEPRVMASGAA